MVFQEDGTVDAAERGADGHGAFLFEVVDVFVQGSEAL